MAVHLRNSTSPSTVLPCQSKQTQVLQFHERTTLRWQLRKDKQMQTVDYKKWLQHLKLGFVPTLPRASFKDLHLVPYQTRVCLKSTQTQLHQHGFRRKQANRHNTMHVIHVHSCRYMQPVVLWNTRVQGKECCLLCSPHTRHRNAMPGTRYSRTHTIAHAKRRRTGRCRPTASFPFSF